MICPVCEHQQDFGFECEVCGKDLGGLNALGPPPVQNERIEGLETTIPEKVGEVAVERVGELEQTHHAKVNVAPDVTPDLERGRAPDVGAVPVERMQDMTVDRAPDDGVRTALPTGALTCRYCRHVQAVGSVCERCGMKLPRPVAVAEPVRAAKGEPVKVRCKACGAPATAGERCTDCGHEVPFPT